MRNIIYIDKPVLRFSTMRFWRKISKRFLADLLWHGKAHTRARLIYMYGRDHANEFDHT